MSICRVVVHTSLLVTLVASCTQPDTSRAPTLGTDLRTALQVANANPVGVTVAPGSGDRYVFDDNAGIFRMHEDGSATRVLSMSQFPDPGVQIRYPFTDFVAITDESFALTAIGDGFLLHTARRELTQHFCYEPGGSFPASQEQRTDAVTYDTRTGRLVAQPQTYDIDTGQVLMSQIGFYDATTGADVEWYNTPVDFLASGMTFDDKGQLLLVEGSDLYRFDFDSQQLVALYDLAQYGVSRASGIAFDAATATLVVVDSETDQLLEIALTK